MFLAGVAVGIGILGLGVDLSIAVACRNVVVRCFKSILDMMIGLIIVRTGSSRRSFYWRAAGIRCSEDWCADGLQEIKMVNSSANRIRARRLDGSRSDDSIKFARMNLQNTSRFPQLPRRLIILDKNEISRFHGANILLTRQWFA
jgi:hypothetical protein